MHGEGAAWLYQAVHQRNGRLRTHHYISSTLPGAPRLPYTGARSARCGRWGAGSTGAEMATKGTSRQIEPLNILVIDDEVDLRNLFARLLNGEQHQVVLAESAEEGLQLLPHWTFHIAFVDQ